ncbi:unnamed protein product, partial [Mesorhabditis spiculigera]
MNRRLMEYSSRKGGHLQEIGRDSSASSMFPSMLFTLWMDFVVIQYYRYVRDRQLEIEQSEQLPLYSQMMKT